MYRNGTGRCENVDRVREVSAAPEGQEHADAPPALPTKRAGGAFGPAQGAVWPRRKEG